MLFRIFHLESSKMIFTVRNKKAFTFLTLLMYWFLLVTLMQINLIFFVTFIADLVTATSDYDYGVVDYRLDNYSQSERLSPSLPEIGLNFPRSEGEPDPTSSTSDNFADESCPQTCSSMGANMSESNEEKGNDSRHVTFDKSGQSMIYPYYNVDIGANWITSPINPDLETCTWSSESESESTESGPGSSPVVHRFVDSEDDIGGYPPGSDSANSGSEDFSPMHKESTDSDDILLQKLNIERSNINNLDSHASNLQKRKQSKTHVADNSLVQQSSAERMSEEFVCESIASDNQFFHDSKFEIFH